MYQCVLKTNLVNLKNENLEMQIKEKQYKGAVWH